VTKEEEDNRKGEVEGKWDTCDLYYTDVLGDWDLNEYEKVEIETIKW